MRYQWSCYLHCRQTGRLHRLRVLARLGALSHLLSNCAAMDPNEVYITEVEKDG